MWKLETSERIACWRDFRKSLDDLPLDDAVQAVAEFWHNCPYQPYYLDPADPMSWPTAWELISENYYCDLAKALGMLYTICLTQHGNTLDVEIHIYNDPITGYAYHLPVLAQGKYVVNFIDNKIVNIESINKKLKLKRRYSGEELKLK
jgi:hypothetical protein